MSEAETLDLIAVYAANFMTSMTMYVSFTLAYLTAAYFVGRGLSPFQAFALSGLYIGAALAAGSSCVASVQVWGALVETHPPTLANLSLYRNGVWDQYMSILLVTGVLISLYFMFDIRRRVMDAEA